ncbi:MAG: signal peptidase II [Bdellovibrionaceae bacterium]|nr:signal peptidase II [Pseudobdellovibrionaceae bacterium]NUM57096.1 signal peptidase II [Pseudobdellovibrionaceae bacterium]
MKKKYILLLLISCLVIVLDQVTKIYIHTKFQLGESIVIVKNFFNFTYVRNYGAAFGFLADSHPTFREIFFLSMPPIAIVIILMILRTVKDNDFLQISALSLICGGALGNYIDRINYRYVIDFLDFHLYNKYSYPAFNIADSAIVGGVGILILVMLLEKKKEAAKTINHSQA